MSILFKFHTISAAQGGLFIVDRRWNVVKKCYQLFLQLCMQPWERVMQVQRLLPLPHLYLHETTLPIGDEDDMSRFKA